MTSRRGAGFFGSLAAALVAGSLLWAPLPGPAGVLQAQSRAPALDAVEEHIRSGRFPEAREALEQWWLGESGAPRQDRQHALWLRARLTVDPALAELDYRRLVVEYPGGEWSDAALLRLAQGAEFRGDSGEAYQYLEVLVRDYPQSALRVEARDRMVRMARIDAQAARSAAPSIREGPPPAPPARPAPGPPGPPPPPRPEPPPPARQEPSPPQVTEPAPERAEPPPLPEAPAPEEEATPPAEPTAAPPAAPAPEAEGSFTIQFGAFSLEEGARAHAATLRSAGLEVRVVQVEGSPLFRVRMGAYVTRAQAEAAARLPQDLGFETMVGVDRERELAPG